ncbi:MAG: hypothetical protein KAG72_15650 [Abyssibacter sp.]|nr:EF-hand domain-containing protein [Abyssibacter sp.]MCK5860785.1 hypothetical protein [Abyssibacter sp.]
MFAVACGNSDNTYQTSEADEVAEDGEPTTETQTIADASAAPGAKSWDSENYSTIEDRSPNERLPAMEAQQTRETAQAELTRTRAEIETLATEAFQTADANNDGAIDREEYVQLALASARDFDSFVTQPVNLMSVNPAADPETAVTEQDVAAADEAAPEQEMTPDETGAPTQTAEAAPLDEAEAATIETAATDTFEQAAGDDGEMTPQELRTAFLARFDEADADGDDELDEAELQTFAALTRGEGGAPAPENN